MLIIFFWLLVWQGVAWIVGNKILLEGPIGVAMRLIEDLQTLEYYQTVGLSVLRIMGGLTCGLILAVCLGVLSWKQKTVEEFLLPLIQFFKAAPITCFVVLLLIWTGSDMLAFYIALLVAFPPVYFNLLEGLKQMDKKLLEVAKVYRMPFKKRLRYIYLPGVKPYFISALSIAIGMSFKAGIAAEIIGTPDYSMGERIYMSKIYLDTAGVFSWMITVIFVAYICEKVVVKLCEVFFEKPSAKLKPKKNQELQKSENIVLTNCAVSYGKEPVLSNINGEFEQGKIYAITGESGIGKTTFLKLLWSLIKTDEGEVSGTECIGAGVFQENRLFEEYTAVENIFATGQCQKSETEVMSVLAELLPQEAMQKPVKEYSGGMKRRVDVARAMLSNSPVILLDEPFAGLDEGTKSRMISFIKKYRDNRTILFTTHCGIDIKEIDAKEFKL
ncbi:MAG: ATP-binding cassette domain-containing protein [Lachnospiraceae bacterium]|nr:ATP-binding cassette domain-containing protein [Lachnospiraceae bacterium]